MGTIDLTDVGLRSRMRYVLCDCGGERTARHMRNCLRELVVRDDIALRDAARAEQREAIIAPIEKAVRLLSGVDTDDMRSCISTARAIIAAIRAQGGEK